VVARGEDLTRRSGTAGNSEHTEAERSKIPDRGQPAMPRLRILSNTGAICLR
jgi:hypothetical protein